jgi:hypothetical protein
MDEILIISKQIRFYWSSHFSGRLHLDDYFSPPIISVVRWFWPFTQFGSTLYCETSSIFSCHEVSDGYISDRQGRYVLFEEQSRFALRVIPNVDDEGASAQVILELEKAWLGAGDVDVEEKLGPLRDTATVLCGLSDIRPSMTKDSSKGEPVRLVSARNYSELHEQAKRGHVRLFMTVTVQRRKHTWAIRTHEICIKSRWIQYRLRS